MLTEPGPTKAGNPGMFNLTHIKRIGIALVGAAAFATAAHAGGTDAGTTVSNTFTLNYDVAGVAQPPIDNTGTPTTFTVDRLVDLTITALNPTLNVAPNSTGNTVQFRLTNLGNDNQAYDLSVSTAGSTYTPGNVTITYFIDTNGDGLPNEAIQSYTPGNATLDVAKDEDVYVTVSSDVPSGTPDGQTANLILTADTLHPVTTLNTCSTCVAGDPVVGDSDGNTLNSEAETVLADGAGTTDSANQGDYSAQSVLTVEAPTLVATKTVLVFDTDPASEAACEALTAPQSGDQYSVPGACIQYVISVANSGSGSATNLDIQDQLPGDVRFLKAELATTTATGFADDTNIGGAGPILTAPGAAVDCDGSSNCLVQLTDAILGSSEDGQVKIWALIR